MRRKLPYESVTKIPIDYFEKNKDIRQKCARWANDHIKALKKSMVEVSFQDAFDRYLPIDTPSQNSTALHPNIGTGFTDFKNSTTTPPVELQNSRKPNAGKGCREVELAVGGTGGREVYPPGFLKALATAASGLNVTPDQVAADLDPDDYQAFIDHPETAKSIAERLAYRK